MENNFLHLNKAINYLLQLGMLVIVLLLTGICCNKTNGQDIKFYNINEPVTLNQELLKDKNVDVHRLNNLLTSINTTIYLTNGNKQVNGSGTPVAVDTDIKSIKDLYTENPMFNQVEIIKININSLNEFNFILNADNLQSFYRLKYILADFSFDVCGNQTSECLNTKMKNIIKCDDCNIIVLSRLSIPN